MKPCIDNPSTGKNPYGSKWLDGRAVGWHVYAQLLAGWEAMRPITMREAAERLGCSVRVLYRARGI